MSLRKNRNSRQQRIEAVAQSENILTQFSNRIIEYGVDALSYHQFTPLTMMDEEDYAVRFAATLQSSDTSTLDYEKLTLSYYRKCFPNLQALFCSLTKHESVEDILDHSTSLTRLPKGEVKHDTLLIPTFSALNCVGIFTLNIEKAHTTLASEIDRAGLIGQLLMQTQACHIDVCQTQTEQYAQLVRLSERERQILRWVAKGKSNGVIAEILGISTHTVTGYLRNIYLKTQTNDRTSAAIFAIQQGILHMRQMPKNETKLKIAV